MMHNECGAEHPNAGCMRDGKCRFDYPKGFNEETSANDDGYPEYAR